MTEKLTIRQVTSATELPLLAHIFDESLKAVDSFHEVLSLYSPNPAYEGSLKGLQGAIEDPEHQFVFKATVSEVDEKTGEAVEIVVGVSHWFFGYISIPKIDPFEKKKGKPTSDAVDEKLIAPMPPVKNVGQKAYEEFSRQIGNAYIGTIRGKKHIYLRRIAVLPTYQRRGIASRLLEWGTEQADREGLHAWLIARPAGMKMYEKAGWIRLPEINFDLPELHIAPTFPMLRKPRPEYKNR